MHGTGLFEIAVTERVESKAFAMTNAEIYFTHTLEIELQFALVEQRF